MPAHARGLETWRRWMAAVDVDTGRIVGEKYLCDKAAMAGSILEMNGMNGYMSTTESRTGLRTIFGAGALVMLLVCADAKIESKWGK